MSPITLWHNPRCSKSRATAKLLEENNVEARIVRYLDETLTKDELENVLDMLSMKPRELMRTKEDIYKELDLKNEYDHHKLIEAMINNPKLIERPIVIKDNKAVIGRPIENVINLLNIKEK